MAGRTLEERVTALENTVAGLQKLPGEMAAFRHEFDSFRREVNTRFDGVDAGLDKVERRMTEEIEHLYARMRLLHENLIDRIKIGGEVRDDSEPPTPRRRKRGPKR